MRNSNLTIEVVLEEWHGKVYFGSSHFQVIKLIQKYKGLIEEVVMVGQGSVPIGNKCIFLSISRYVSGFGGYGFSFSSSITSICKAFVLVQEVCSKLSKFLKAFS